MFTAGLTTDADFGSEVVRVIATDPDVGINAKLSYYIRKPVQSTLLSRSGQEEQIGVNPFVIDRETGIVSLNFDPQRDMKGYFDMEVIFRYFTYANNFRFESCNLYKKWTFKFIPFYLFSFMF